MNTTKYTVRISTYVTIDVEPDLIDKDHSILEYAIYERAVDDFVRSIDLPENMSIALSDSDAETFDIFDVVRPAS